MVYLNHLIEIDGRTLIYHLIFIFGYNIYGMSIIDLVSIIIDLSIVFTLIVLDYYILVII